eukprot:GHVH01008033.1.p1 GENE.GHVH01008033.1~~GHVH01008033.1.p1  ORF type:complete len:1775 (-),score=170.13 GHVH01008033.1:3921-9245(-)
MNGICPDPKAIDAAIEESWNRMHNNSQPQTTFNSERSDDNDEPPSFIYPPGKLALFKGPLSAKHIGLRIRMVIEKKPQVQKMTTTTSAEVVELGARFDGTVKDLHMQIEGVITNYWARPLSGTGFVQIRLIIPKKSADGAAVNGILPAFMGGVNFDKEFIPTPSSPWPWNANFSENGLGDVLWSDLSMHRFWISESVRPDLPFTRTIYFYPTPFWDRRMAMRIATEVIDSLPPSSQHAGKRDTDCIICGTSVLYAPYNRDETQLPVDIRHPQQHHFYVDGYEALRARACIIADYGDEIGSCPNANRDHVTRLCSVNKSKIMKMDLNDIVKCRICRSLIHRICLHPNWRRNLQGTTSEEVDAIADGINLNLVKDRTSRQRQYRRLSGHPSRSENNWIPPPPGVLVNSKHKDIERTIELLINYQESDDRFRNLLAANPYNRLLLRTDSRSSAEAQVDLDDDSTLERVVCPNCTPCNSCLMPSTRVVYDHAKTKELSELKHIQSAITDSLAKGQYGSPDVYPYYLEQGRMRHREFESSILWTRQVHTNLDHRGLIRSLRNIYLLSTPKTWCYLNALIKNGVEHCKSADQWTSLLDRVQTMSSNADHSVDESDQGSDDGDGVVDFVDDPIGVTRPLLKPDLEIVPFIESSDCIGVLVRGTQLLKAHDDLNLISYDDHEVAVDRIFKSLDEPIENDDEDSLYARAIRDELVDVWSDADIDRLSLTHQKQLRTIEENAIMCLPPNDMSKAKVQSNVDVADDVNKLRDALQEAYLSKHSTETVRLYYEPCDENNEPAGFEKYYDVHVGERFDACSSFSDRETEKDEDGFEKELCPTLDDEQDTVVYYHEDYGYTDKSKQRFIRQRERQITYFDVEDQRTSHTETTAVPRTSHTTAVPRSQPTVMIENTPVGGKPVLWNFEDRFTPTQLSTPCCLTIKKSGIPMQTKAGLHWWRDLQLEDLMTLYFEVMHREMYLTGGIPADAYLNPYDHTPSPITTLLGYVSKQQYAGSALRNTFDMNARSKRLCLNINQRHWHARTKHNTEKVLKLHEDLDTDHRSILIYLMHNHLIADDVIEYIQQHIRTDENGRDLSNRLASLTPSFLSKLTREIGDIATILSPQLPIVRNLAVPTVVQCSACGLIIHGDCLNPTDFSTFVMYRRRSIQDTSFYCQSCMKCRECGYRPPLSYSETSLESERYRNGLRMLIRYYIPSQLCLVCYLKKVQSQFCSICHQLHLANQKPVRMHFHLNESEVLPNTPVFITEKRYIRARRGHLIVPSPTHYREEYGVFRPEAEAVGEGSMNETNRLDQLELRADYNADTFFRLSIEEITVDEVKRMLTPGVPVGHTVFDKLRKRIMKQRAISMDDIVHYMHQDVYINSPSLCLVYPWVRANDSAQVNRGAVNQSDSTSTNRLWSRAPCRICCNQTCNDCSTIVERGSPLSPHSISGVCFGCNGILAMMRPSNLVSSLILLHPDTVLRLPTYFMLPQANHSMLGQDGPFIKMHLRTTLSHMKVKADAGAYPNAQGSEALCVLMDYLNNLNANLQCIPWYHENVTHFKNYGVHLVYAMNMIAPTTMYCLDVMWCFMQTSSCQRSSKKVNIGLVTRSEEVINHRLLSQGVMYKEKPCDFSRTDKVYRYQQDHFRVPELQDSRVDKNVYWYAPTFAKYLEENQRMMYAYQDEPEKIKKVITWDQHPQAIGPLIFHPRIYFHMFFARRLDLYSCPIHYRAVILALIMQMRLDTRKSPRPFQYLSELARTLGPYQYIVDHDAETVHQLAPAYGSGSVIG